MLDKQYERIPRRVWTLARDARGVGTLLRLRHRFPDQMRVDTEVVEHRRAPTRQLLLVVARVGRDRGRGRGGDLRLQHRLEQLRL